MVTIIGLEKMGLSLTFSDDLKQIEIHSKDGAVIVVETLDALDLAISLNNMVRIWAEREKKIIDEQIENIKQENNL